MLQITFNLNTSTMAVLDENSQPSFVTVPSNVLVTLVAGDVDGNGFVKVRYQDKVLSMFAVDLRTRAERMWAQSA